MTLKFDYSTIKIIRQNLPFITGLTTLCAVSLFIMYFNTRQYQINLVKIKSLKEEIDGYDKKKKLLDFKSQVLDSEIDMDVANQALSQLIPNKEDYFSILVALEKLSAKTNFIITSYNIVVSASTKEKLAIVIEGEGNPNNFLQFLNEYNFSGGRLVTIDNIEFNQEIFTGAKVNIYVYSGKAGVLKTSDTSSDVDIATIKKIIDKVEIQLKDENNQVVDYPTKSNPF